MAMTHRTRDIPTRQEPTAARPASPAATTLRELADAIIAHDFDRARAMLPKLRAAGWSVVPIASRREVGR